MAKNLGALLVRAREYNARDWTYMQPFTAEMNATTMRALMKCPDDFQPAFVNAIVNGEEAVLECALIS